MSLTRLGFAADEIFPCVAWPSGQVGARAEIHGEEAVLRVRTGLRLDVWLRGYYVHRLGLPIVSGADDDGLCRLTEFFALGRSRKFDTAKFSGGPKAGSTSTFAGELGVEYLNDAVLALDAAGPTIGLSTRDSIREWPEPPVCSLPLVAEAGECVPVTQSVKDGHAPGAMPALVLDSGIAQSTLTRSYVERHWVGRRLVKAATRALSKETTVEVPFELPNGLIVKLDVRIEEESPQYAVPLDVDELHGRLGIDFLRRWMQVFDFPRNQLLLFDYSASRSASNQSTTSSRR